MLDVTHLEKPVPVAGASVPLADARNIYVARTYAYVAAGKQGMAIVNVEQPEHPVLDQVFNAGGKLNDVHDVKIGMVDASLFAFVADGKNGLRVVQLFSPDERSRVLRLQPQAHAQADRHLPHRRPGARHFQGHRSRPRRG